MSETKPAADVVVVGGGVIGLSLALEMRERGARVIVVERGRAMQQASSAAAGMLAVNDTDNPPELLSLARLSVALYPAFLRRVEALSGKAVPFQTDAVVQYAGDGSATRLQEWSLDPRQLAAAMLAALPVAGISLVEGFAMERVEGTPGGLRIFGADGSEVAARQVVYAGGAWAKAWGGQMSVTPRKGQMLRVRMPEGLALDAVHRSEKVYVVPRRFGPQAGTALIGATVEDVGFDVTVHAEDLARLRELAADLVPALRPQAAAPMVEAWAGLRPVTPDGLPVMGRVSERCFYAGGHYRNGVLLAPASAVAMADLLTGKTPPVDLETFSAERFLR